MIDIKSYMGVNVRVFLMDCITGLPFFTIVANCVLHKPLSSLLCNIARGSCWRPSADSGQKLLRKKSGLGLEK